MALTDPDDIIERLTKRKEFQTNLKDVFNEGDLENAIKDGLEGGSDKIKVKGSQGWFTTTKEDARQELIDNRNDLFKAEEIKETVKENAIKKIDSSSDIRDLNVNFDMINAEIGDIGRAKELEIQKSYFDKSKELVREQPESMSREQLLDEGYYNVSLRKVARELGLSEERTRKKFEDEGFSIDEKNVIRK